MGLLAGLVATAAPAEPSATPMGVQGQLQTAGVTARVIPLGSPGCRPQCGKRTCGGDGCGGTCGACAKGRYCVKDRCVKGNQDPCVRMTGRWRGAMLINPVHRLNGRVRRSGKVCKARFRVSFTSGGRREWVVQDFVVTFRGGIVRFQGRRIVSSTSGSAYSLDTFTGRLDASHRRFNGKLRDTRNVTGPVVLRR